MPDITVLKFLEGACVNCVALAPPLMRYFLAPLAKYDDKLRN